MSAITSSTDQSITHNVTASRNQTEKKVTFFYRFLCISLENANTDRLKLAHKQWKRLKDSNVIMPNLINEVFNIYDGSEETLKKFLHKSEQEAFSIQQACRKFLSNESSNSKI